MIKYSYVVLTLPTTTSHRAAIDRVTAVSREEATRRRTDGRRSEWQGNIISCVVKTTERGGEQVGGPGKRG